MVERRPWPELAADEAPSIADFANAAAARYPYDQEVDGLERAEQATLAEPDAAGLYMKRLLNPAYACAAQRQSGEGSSPAATAPRTAPACRNAIRAACGARRALDAYAHHPYPIPPAETPFSGGLHARALTLTMAYAGRT